MRSDTLRDNFLDFFKSKKHKIVESDSLVPADDPTVLFTPAGMNQFKKQFLGVASDFRRAATAQRCLRTDDLDKVGKTPGHHTFFEMLGNFSFGDYFKEEAIAWAWEFLTRELKITKEKLWISVYKEDEESYRIWKDKIKIPQDRIIKLGDKENFWPSEAKEKGPNGPCGPCSEIFFDQGTAVGCVRPDCDPSCNCGRFVEVWNLVFTQFNRKVGGILEPLPKKNIDTGMGLERLAAVIQGVYSNFQTDLFQPIIKEITSSLKPQASSQKELIYAIADHIRAIAFAIYDGVLPSNEDRGYVIRKLIRKSTLHLRALGVKKAYLYKLIPVLSEAMEHPYPELKKRRENIAQIILAEETSFIATLNSSPRLFKEMEFVKSDPQGTAHKVFQLYDTYGIPYELTKEWLDTKAIEIAQDAFEKDLLAQKTRSKLQSAMKGDIFDIREVDLNLKETRFTGYKECQSQAKILKIIKDGREVKKIERDETAEVILDKTPFYAEAGGQIGDAGQLIKGKNIFAVSDTQKLGKAVMHIGKVKQGIFSKNNLVRARVDVERRVAIARNHTATHLLQAALRKVLGLHVQQQGSWVGPDRLRFDFTHFKDIKKDELDRIEEIVNNYIINNYPLMPKHLSLAEAKKQGALAFFAKEYEGKVRMISIGDVSKELCAGTHLGSTGQIGVFKITQEGSVASGIRRIEATTGNFAYKIIKEEDNILVDVSSKLNVPYQKITEELQKKLLRIKELERQLNLQRLDIVKGSLDSLVQDATKINNMNIITDVIEDLDMGLLRKTVDLIKQKTGNAIIALGSSSQGRALLVMGVTADLCQKGIDASKLILDVASIIGGSGGGRKDFAQAGGNKPENFPAAFKKLKGILNNLK